MNAIIAGKPKVSVFTSSSLLMFVLAKCTWDGGGYETEWQFESKAIFKIDNMTLLKAQVLPQQNATLGLLSSK